MNNTHYCSNTHLRSLELHLGRKIENKIKIYLDTKYWLILRDVYMGRSRETSHEKLFKLLYEYSQKDLVVCPCYLPTFLELCRQTDQDTLQNSAELIDLLSGGVCLKNPHDRIALEILYFFRVHTQGIESCHNPRFLAWTKIPHILGVRFPSLPFLDEINNNKLQIEYLNHIWNHRLQDIFNIIEHSELYNRFGRKRLRTANKLNRCKHKYSNELKSLKQTILIEASGILGALDPLFKELSAYMYIEETNNAPSHEDLEKSNAGQLMARTIYNYFKSVNIDTKFPTIRIPATLHAAIRWDKNRQFKENDILDIEHASGALPYCDIFLTEKSLCSLVTRKDIAFDKLYKCCVLHDARLACEEIENLLYNFHS